MKALGILKELARDPLELRSRSTILDCLDTILKSNLRQRDIVVDPVTKEVNASICILVNGGAIDKLDAELAEGDELTLFIAASGG